MDPKLVFAVQALTNLTSYTLLMLWFVYPRLRGRAIEDALIPLAALHLFRTLGMFAVQPGFTGATIAASTWAAHVAIGDFITVVLAMFTVAALRRRHRHAIALAWVMNLWGSLDVLNAFVNMLRERLLDQPIGPQGLVIAFGVPALIVTHATMYVLLLRRRPVSSSSDRAPAPGGAATG